ncbi:hypothetical protein [Streptomyces sp. NPDC055506]
MLPLVVLAGGTTAMGVYPCVVLGAPAMFGAIGASRPLLRKVTAEPTQTAD